MLHRVGEVQVAMSTYTQVDRNATAGFVLTLMSGLLLIVNGAALGIIGAGYTYIDPKYYLGYYLGESTAFYVIAIGVTCGLLGLLVITGAILIRMGHTTEGGLVAIILSTLGLFLGGGFIVGTVFGIIGGILAVLER